MMLFSDYISKKVTVIMKGAKLHIEAFSSMAEEVHQLISSIAKKITKIFR